MRCKYCLLSVASVQTYKFAAYFKVLAVCVRACVCVCSQFLCHLVTANKKSRVCPVHVHILSSVEHRQLKQLLDVFRRTSVASKVMKSGNSRFAVTICNLPALFRPTARLYIHINCVVNVEILGPYVILFSVYWAPFQGGKAAEALS